MKHNRERFREHHFARKAGFCDKHHLRPGSRGGQSIGSNLFLLDAYKHSAWHLLFKNLTLEEIILLLQRVKRIKDSQKMRRLI